MSVNSAADVDDVEEYWKKLKSLILENKHLSQLKAHGPSMPISTKRLSNECKALKRFNVACPGSAPEVYLYSQENNMALMEDLVGYEDMTVQLERGSFDLEAIRNSAIILAKFHTMTHSTQLTAEEFQSLIDEFWIEELIKIQNALIKRALDSEYLIERSVIHPAALPIALEALENEKFRNKMDKIEELLISKNECLVHRDCSYRNMLSKGSSVKVVDAEGGRVGAIGSDLSRPFTSLVNHYHAHRAQMKTGDDVQHHRAAANKMLEACKIIIPTYFEHMSCTTGDRDDYMRQIISDTATIAGACFIYLNHLVGQSFMDYGIEDVAVQIEKVGIQLVLKSDTIHTVEEFLEAASVTKLT